MLRRVLSGCALGLGIGAVGFAGCTAATPAPQVTQVAVVDLEARPTVSAGAAVAGKNAAAPSAAPTAPGSPSEVATATDDGTTADGDEAEPGAERSKGEEGTMGTADGGVQRYAILGVLSSNADAGSIASIFGSDSAFDQAAMGGLIGTGSGGGFGAGGLGLAGTGASAGGGMGTIGLGSIGTIGHGAGTGTGQGYGSGSGRLGSSRKQSSSQVRLGATAVTGSLPPEVIQRIVRSHLNQFRYCYEKALSSKPDLRGRVATRFVISKDGSVSSVQDAGSDLKDASVKKCVQSRFYTMSFPAPEGGGVVTVVYPLMFQPGDPEKPQKKAIPAGSGSGSPPAAPLTGPSAPTAP